MKESPHIHNITASSFDRLVIEQSHTAPVLVDFWADWCGPCQMQMPVLAKLVAEFDGQFSLAKVNTDEERALAGEHGIRSLPTMRLYRNGTVVEEILGAQTESTLRGLLDRYIERASDRLRLAALELHRQGKSGEALALLGEAQQADPDNHRVALDRAQVALDLGELTETGTLLGALPREVRDEAEATRLQARLEFARVVQAAPPVTELEQHLDRDSSDTEARYQLAAHRVLADNLEAAMTELLYIIQHDRGFRDDAGRKGLLAVFELLGDEGDLVSSYRRKLFNIMH